MAFKWPVPGHLVGMPGHKEVFVSSAVIPMGWLNAVGLFQHLHRRRKVPNIPNQQNGDGIAQFHKVQLTQGKGPMMVGFNTIWMTSAALSLWRKGSAPSFLSFLRLASQLREPTRSPKSASASSSESPSEDSASRDPWLFTCPVSAFESVLSTSSLLSPFLAFRPSAASTAFPANTEAGGLLRNSPFRP